MFEFRTGALPTRAQGGIAGPAWVAARTSASPTTNRRDPSIEAVRGLACLMVVVYHMVGGSPRSGLLVPEGDALRVVVDALAVVRMPMFAFVGGTVYAIATRRGLDARRMLAARGRRVLAPLVTVTTLYAATQLVAPGVNNRPPTDPVSLYLMPFAHLWYLQAMFLVTVAVIGWEARFGRSRRAFWALTAASLAGFALRGHATDVFSLDGALYLAPFYVAGLGLRRAALPERVARAAGPALLGLGVVAAAALFMDAGAATVLAKHAVMPGVAGKLCVLLAGVGVSGGLLMSLRGAAGPIVRALGVVGAASYTIYLYHIFGTAGARTLLPMLGVEGLWAMTTLGVVIGVAGPLAMHHALSALAGRSALPLPLVLAGIEGRAPRRVAARALAEGRSPR